MKPSVKIQKSKKQNSMCPTQKVLLKKKLFLNTGVCCVRYVILLNVFLNALKLKCYFREIRKVLLKLQIHFVYMRTLKLEHKRKLANIVIVLKISDLKH